MKPFSILLICLLVSYYSSTAQVKVVIASESKVLHTESGVLEKLASGKLREQVLDLQNRLREVAASEIKSIIKQSTRDEFVKLYLSNFRLKMINYGNTICLDFTLPYNTLDLRITTPDNALGFGKHRDADPSLRMNFDVVARVPLVQGATKGSVEFDTPTWNFIVRSYHSTGYKKKDREKIAIGTWILGGNMASAFRKVFYALDPIKDVLNEHLRNNIINHPELQKEYALDEDTRLQVMNVGDTTLLFRHPYSSRGLAKRSATENASELTKPAAITALPVSKPIGSSADKPAPSAAAVPANSVPVSTTPSGVNQGVRSIPKKKLTDKKVVGGRSGLR